MKQKNKYVEAMEKITTPIPLKQKVGEEIRRQIARRRWIRIGYSVGAVAASLLIVIGLGFFLGATDELIRSDLVAGQHSREVLLQDGELNFVLLGEDEHRAGLRLAARYPVQHQLDLLSFLGDFFTGYSEGFSYPEGLSRLEGELTGYSSMLGGSIEFRFGEGTFQVDAGGILRFSFTDNRSLISLPIPIEGSYIGDTVVGVGFAESENVYYGVFEREGVLFVLVGEDVEQEEFIRFMHYFVTY